MSEIPLVPPGESTSDKPKPIPISINGNTVDPNAPTLRGAFGLGVGDAARSDYILVQTRDFLTKDDKKKLADLKVEVKELISDKTYLCHFTPKDLQGVRDLKFVTWASVYSSQFVVSSELKSDLGATMALSPASASAGAREVDVMFHDANEQSTEHLIQAVAEAAHVHPTTLKATKNCLRLVVQDQYLNAVAKVDEVRAIVPVVDAKLYNNVARNIMMARGNQTDFEDLKKDGLVLDGQGEIVAVADTGVDAAHEAFKDRIHDQQAWGRLSRPGRPGRPAIEERTDDPKGHGTHVCGSVLGDGIYKTPTENTVVRGTAPKAKLVIQSILDDNGLLGGIPPDLNELFGRAYDKDARVHNDSWGYTQRGLPYGESGAQIDKFVFEHPDMVICWAAGNEAVDFDQNGVVDMRSIGSHAAAKNCLTIGASESFRPQGALRYGQFPDEDGNIIFQASPIRTDETADDSEGMAAFSNRGPSREGRIKPDVVAPGTCILSARSSIAPQQQAWAHSADPAWMYDGGTSMASPLVAGGCALLRQALRSQLSDADKEKQLPTAALIKALIINGAVELKGQYIPTEAGPSPNFSSGWGRVHLKKSADMATYAKPTDTIHIGCHEGEALTDDSDPYRRGVVIEGNGKTLKVTLVWSDPPGAFLQNDLDLSVTVNGTTKRGNPTINRNNNVEQVLWTNVPSGTAQVQVKVVRLSVGTQPFALAWAVE